MLFKKITQLVVLEFVVILAAILIYFHYFYNTLVYREQMNIYDQSLTSGCDEVNGIFSAVRRAILEACILDSVQEVCRQGQAAPDLAEMAVNDLESLSRQVSGMSMQIFLRDDSSAWKELNRDGSLRDSAAVNTAMFSRTEQGSSRFNWYFDGYDTYTIQVYKGVYGIGNWDRLAGILVARVRLLTITPLINSISMGRSGATAYLLDGEDRVLYPLGRDMVLDLQPADIAQAAGGFRFGSYRTVLKGELTENDWSILLTVDSPTLFGEASELMGAVVAVICVIFFCGMTAAVLTTYNTTRPITKLAEDIKNMGINDQALPVPEKRPYQGEAKVLYDNFNAFLQTRDKLKDEIYNLLLLKNQAELKSLQAQINPHFLYNTLDSINWMAMKYDAKDIQAITVSFANMLRFSLNNGQDSICIRDELEQVKGYIRIQQIRFPGQFTYTFDVDESVLEYRIIKLLLQPLVENAILHGFQEADVPGNLVVRVKTEPGYITFSVINNGRQMDLEAIQRALYPPEDTPPKSYGLRNVNERLGRCYGKMSRLRFWLEGENSVATFRIPDNEGRPV